MIIAFVRNMKGVRKAGEAAKVEVVKGKSLVLENGKRIFARGASDFIDVGEMRKIELCETASFGSVATKKAEILPDFTYKDLAECAKKMLHKIMTDVQ